MMRHGWSTLPYPTRRLAMLLALSGLVLLVQAMFLVGTALAHDCQSDWRRAEDCLRTPGFAEGLGTAIGTIVTVLVNGVVIAQTILSPAQGGDQPGDDDERTEYSLDIRTQDQRTVLAADGVDVVWVYGQVRCSDPKVDTASLTRGLRFVADGPNAAWLTVGASQMSGGFKAVPVRASPPTAEAEPDGDSATITVSAMIEGRLIGGPVALVLDDSRYELEIL